MTLGKILYNSVKSAGYEASKGGLVVGGAALNLTDADFWTVLYFVMVAVIFDVVKEVLKNFAQK